jgi:hypothetical protein
LRKIGACPLCRKCVHFKALLFFWKHHKICAAKRSGYTLLLLATKPTHKASAVG